MFINNIKISLAPKPPQHNRAAPTKTSAKEPQAKPQNQPQAIWLQKTFGRSMTGGGCGGALVCSFARSAKNGKCIKV